MSQQSQPNKPHKSQKDYKNQCSGTFRHFFDTPGGEGREDLLEIFWGFRGSGVWRLLYMGAVIVRKDSFWAQKLGGQTTPSSRQGLLGQNLSNTKGHDSDIIKHKLIRHKLGEVA